MLWIDFIAPDSKVLKYKINIVFSCTADAVFILRITQREYTLDIIFQYRGSKSCSTLWCNLFKNGFLI